MPSRYEIEDDKPLDYIERAVKNSDCRTPIIFVQEDGDPLRSAQILAKEVLSAVWTFDLEQLKSAKNVMDYVDVGIKNGDWVYITNCDTVDESFFREVARTLYLLTPDPEKFPRREFFRSFFGVKKPFDYNDSTGPFPTLMIKNAIIARKHDEVTKWSQKMPVNDPLFKEAVVKHDRRREVGRESDSESDIDEHTQISGMLFFRSAELSKYVDRSPVTLGTELFLKAVEAQDCDAIKSIIMSGDVNVNHKLKAGMTPIQYASSLHLTESAKALLEVGADPNAPRESDNRPPLFMAMEDLELAKALVAAGADLFLKFQGYRCDNHPDTAPEVSAFLVKERYRE